MNTQFPPLASATWVGYISTPKFFDLEDPSGREVNLRPEFTLPSQGNGAPFAGPFPWRVVAGIRSIPDQSQAGAVVNCSSVGTVCADSPPSGVATSLTTSVSDFGVQDGADATAGHGETATVTFPVSYLDGAGKGTQDLTIAATTNLPGTNATPGGTALQITPGSLNTVSVRFRCRRRPARHVHRHAVRLDRLAGGHALEHRHHPGRRPARPGDPHQHPGRRAKFRLGKRVAADYACTDETNGTGVARCAGPVTPARGSTRGRSGGRRSRSTAADKAGNAATAARSTPSCPACPRRSRSLQLQADHDVHRVHEPAHQGRAEALQGHGDMPPDATGREPVPAKALTKRKASGTVKLKSFVGKRFTPGTVIQIRVTKSGSIGAVKLVKIHANGAPVDRDTLPPPGEKKPRKRC